MYHHVLAYVHVPLCIHINTQSKLGTFIRYLSRTWRCVPRRSGGRGSSDVTAMYGALVHGLGFFLGRLGGSCVGPRGGLEIWFWSRTWEGEDVVLEGSER